MKNSYLNLFTTKIYILFFCLIIGVFSVFGQQMSEDKTLSPYFVVISENPIVDNLPLKETSAKVKIVGVIADVTVKQVYVNEGRSTIEAIYTFPLSTKAAVYAMKMTIGSRVISAKIEEKEKARQDYEQAKSEGKRVSLLEQSRPNIFTMNVGNIAVSDTIIVELHYTELLVPEKGQYTFVYPTVVGPRYFNRANKDEESNIEFVSTPYTSEGIMPSYAFHLEMNINSGIPIQQVNCNTHKINTSYPTLNEAIIQLDTSEMQGGNRDIIVNYSLQGNQIESGIMLYEGKDENFFLMMIQPPKKVLKEDIPPREYIFIVDVSGSMRGFPLEIAKRLLRNLILNLNPDDKFNVVLFSFNTGILNGKSLDANTKNIEKAIQFIDNHKGSGSTELMQGLKDAYNLPRYDENLSRTFVIVTDGYVTVEREAFQYIREHSDNANVFSFGIGSSVNRYLIEGLAFMGNGEPMIITKPSDAASQAEQFRNYINTPVLTRIKVDYGQLQAYDVEPIAIPDMLAERPIIVFGKYKGQATGTVTLTGKAGKKNYKQSFDLSTIKPNKDHAAIRYLWARERIKLLDYLSSSRPYYHATNQDSSYVQRITELGLNYNLMTNYTSFIAIDEQQIVKDGEIITVKQPIPLPEGVSNYAVDGMLSKLPGVAIRGNRAGGQVYMVDGTSSTLSNVSSSSRQYFTPRTPISGYQKKEEKILQKAEIMPEYQGGEIALKEYLKGKFASLNLPDSFSDTMIVRFVVYTDGSILGIEVLQGINKKLDKKVVRIIKSMPKWTPGKQKGIAVAVYYTLPIQFPLE